MRHALVTRMLLPGAPARKQCVLRGGRPVRSSASPPGGRHGGAGQTRFARCSTYTHADGPTRR